jgi:coiled-coil domain-containing protein 130
VDPLVALEKSTEAQNHMNKVQAPRLEALQTLSDHYGDDPYTLSRLVRKRFRGEKKAEKELQAADDALKGRYGLPETLKLTRDDEATMAKDKEEWQKAKREYALQDRSKRRKLESVGIVSRKQLGSSSSIASGSSSRPNNAAELLRARILENSARKKPPNLERK